MLHDHEPPPEALESITLALAEVLGYLRDGLRPREIAKKRGVSYSTVRTQVQQLQQITDLHSMDELADWWAANEHAWVARVAERARISQQPDAHEADAG